MLLLAATVAPGSASADPAQGLPPRVRVVATEAEGERSLYDWLVVRLLEEGYAVAGRDGGEIDLTIWPNERDGWTVRAHGETSENFSVSIGEDEAVARLELLHRAVDALASVRARDRTDDADDRAFAIELAPTIADDKRAPLEADIALAVLDGGGSLAPDRSSASFVMCAAPVEGRMRIEVVQADEACPVPDAAAGELPPPRDQTQELVEAVLLGKEDVPPPEPVVEQAHERERPPAAESPYPTEPAPPTWKNAPLVLRGGAAAGVIGRILEPDPVVAASMFIGREPGVSLWVDLQIWPSRYREPLFITETVPAIGRPVRPLTEGRFSLDLGVLAGLQTHSYTYVSDTERTNGLAVDASGEGAIGFGLNLAADHELHFLFRFGGSTRARTHESFNGTDMWKRNAMRVGFTLGFTFGRRLRT